MQLVTKETVSTQRAHSVLRLNYIVDFFLQTERLGKICAAFD